MTLAYQPSFEELGTPLYDVTFCVVDLETTGGSSHGDAITEIGAVKVRSGELIGEFQTLVNPDAAIPASIVVLTGITQSMVIDAPRIAEVYPSFLEFAGDSVIVAHNKSFDLGFLNAAASRLGYPKLANRSLDTVALARRLVRSEVRSLGLKSLAAHFRSPVTPTHRALDDARATVHVLHGLLERAGTLHVTHLEDLLELPTARGNPHYDKIDLARGLPRRPGVYLFKDRHGTVIYVGKAKNLRTRVSSYFYGDERRSIANLMREMKSVDTIITAGELDASITELRLIHEHIPRYNRASKPPKANHFVTLTAEQFPRLSLTRKLHGDSDFVLGPFRSRRSAELVMHALWDATRIRRCSGKPGTRGGRCAAAQLGVSLCPCDGSIDSAEYRAELYPLQRAADGDPSALLDPLIDRMRAHMLALRYEEAGWVRDRYRALAAALERRREWQELQAAGTLEARDDTGEWVSISGGAHVRSWSEKEGRPLMVVGEPATPTPVPPTVGIAAEARLLWKWLGGKRTRIMTADGRLPDLAPRIQPIAEL
jgi:DNA polymerase-3 subunit epsilon